MDREMGPSNPEGLDAGTREFIVRTLETLNSSGVPFLLAGAYALHRYTGIERHTKDLDVFVLRGDLDRHFRALAEAGYRTELTFPHWLGKAFRGEQFLDLIFSSGNGVAPVDDSWFEHAVAEVVFGVPVRLCPPEEILWQKAFIMDRERFDGADVAHLIQARGEGLDWPRLLRRFGPHWPVLLAHLILFSFIYPSERTRVPDWVLGELFRRQQDERGQASPSDPICRGTILSRAQYLIDIRHRGYRDARLRPEGSMTPEQIARWTEAIETGE
jgi:hypothetical protein